MILYAKLGALGRFLWMSPYAECCQQGVSNDPPQCEVVYVKRLPRLFGDDRRGVQVYNSLREQVVGICL